MAEVKVRIPEEMQDAIAGTSQTIYVEALKEVARRKMPEIRKRFRKINSRIKAFESKYGMPYEEFRRQVPDTVKGHDDWIEWTYLVKLADELSAKTSKLALIVGP